MIDMVATCPEETKELLLDELARLGATSIESAYRAVLFQVDEELFYQIHLQLRTASRLIRVIKDVAAPGPDVLFSQASRIRWDEQFDPKYSYKIDSLQTERGHGVMPSSLVGKKVREGILEFYAKNKKEPPKVNLDESKVIITAFARKGRCVIGLDTSGKSLHKRGYRKDNHPAPVKETLAASLLEMMEYKGQTAFYDPMCGSGTIAIEAAMIALDKSPMIHRKKGQFGFEWHKYFSNSIWRKVQEEARADKRDEPEHKIFASDISEAFLDASRNNALRARVEKHIEFSQGDFFEGEAPAEEGLMLINLPYGERIGGDEARDKEFFKAIGDKLKQSYQGWKVGLLVAEESSFKFIGLKPNRRIPVKNGGLKCKLLIFEIYAGSKKTKPNPE